MKHSPRKNLLFVPFSILGVDFTDGCLCPQSTHKNDFFTRVTLFSLLIWKMYDFIN